MKNAVDALLIENALTSVVSHRTKPEHLMLTDKIAIITGGNGGIGLAVAQSYLEQGARCIVADVNNPSTGFGHLEEQFQHRCVYVQTDITRSADIAKLVAAARDTFGPIDILFNNAAIFDMAPLLESNEDMYDRIFAVNVKGLFFVMQAVAASMVENKRNGAIINMASQAGRRGESLVSHYCASKAAVISYTQSAAMALAKDNIRVNAISPGVVDTPMWDIVDSLFARYENRPIGEKKTAVGNAVPLGRMGLPSDITGAANFLASDHASYITGQTLNVDGGNVLS